MALNPALAKDDDFMLICVAPDVCFTPSKPYAPTPYPIVHKLGKSKGVSTNVFFREKKAYRHKVSFVDSVQGDEPGMGKGLISQTNTKISRFRHSNPAYRFTVNTHAHDCTALWTSVSTNKIFDQKHR